MTVEEEGESASEGIDIESGIDGCLNIGDAISQSESQFLGCGGSRLPDMVTTNAYGIPSGNAVFAVLKDVGNQAHRRARRENIGSPSNVLLQYVVLDGAIQLR